MTKVLKYLKPFTLSIILVIGLLVVQAACDLSLPDYTSNIVNVGIQQNGIENAVPTVIREKELNFVYDDMRKTIIQHNLKDSPDSLMSQFIIAHFPEIWLE